MMSITVIRADCKRAPLYHCSQGNGYQAIKMCFSPAPPGAERPTLGACWQRRPVVRDTRCATDVLLLDDWGLEKLDLGQRNDLLELMEDRHGSRSTVITSQLPVKDWHAAIGDATLADAILDRLVHNSHRIPLKGKLALRGDHLGPEQVINFARMRTNNRAANPASIRGAESEKYSVSNPYGKCNDFLDYTVEWATRFDTVAI